MSADPAAPPAGTKRGPGRPPKKAPAAPIPRRGVADAPLNAKNRMELIHENPATIKNLFAYFKNLKSVEIHVRFDRDGVSFYTRDASRGCCVIARIPGEGLNHYHCGAAFWLGLTRENVERVFGSIDRSFGTVMMSVCADDAEVVTVVFRDPAIDKECIYTIMASVFEPDPELVESDALAAPERFPLSFTLSDRQFKKTATDLGQLGCGELTFEKTGAGGPLRLVFNRVGLSYQEVYPSPEKIALRSAVEEGEVFRCSVPIGGVRALAAAMVTRSVGIYCSGDGNYAAFRQAIDDLTVCTLVRTTA